MTTELPIVTQADIELCVELNIPEYEAPKIALHRMTSTAKADAEAERAAIVKWLRGKADTYRAAVTDCFPPEKMTPELAADTAARWAGLHFAANSIERGQHLPAALAKATTHER